MVKQSNNRIPLSEQPQFKPVPYWPQYFGFQHFGKPLFGEEPSRQHGLGDLGSWKVSNQEQYGDNERGDFGKPYFRRSLRFDDDSDDQKDWRKHRESAQSGGFGFGDEGGWRFEDDGWKRGELGRPRSRQYSHNLRDQNFGDRFDDDDDKREWRKHRESKEFGFGKNVGRRFRFDDDGWKRGDFGRPRPGRNSRNFRDYNFGDRFDDDKDDESKEFVLGNKDSRKFRFDDDGWMRGDFGRPRPERNSQNLRDDNFGDRFDDDKDDESKEFVFGDKDSRRFRFDDDGWKRGGFGRPRPRRNSRDLRDDDFGDRFDEDDDRQEWSKHRESKEFGFGNKDSRRFGSSFGFEANGRKRGDSEKPRPGRNSRDFREDNFENFGIQQGRSEEWSLGRRGGDDGWNGQVEGTFGRSDLEDNGRFDQNYDDDDDNFENRRQGFGIRYPFGTLRFLYSL